MARQPWLVLILPTTSYKAQDFIDAAQRLGVELLVVTDRRQALERAAPGHTLAVSLTDASRGMQQILDHVHSDAGPGEQGVCGVIGVDDETTELAAVVAQRLNLPHNPPAAVRLTRDKFALRQKLLAAGLHGPDCRRFSSETPPSQLPELAGQVRYPCVLKPVDLSASRGVLRADDEAVFPASFSRVAAIVGQAQATPEIVVEDYLDGPELAFEGLLTGGVLEALALFDKPDPLVGPTFEETLYITPSRQPEPIQQAIVEEVRRGCEALGLREGPVHAEVRLDQGQPWIVEVAARTIGGLCSRTLRFGSGSSLEELVIRHALGLGAQENARTEAAAGVLMIPIPRAGRLRQVHGLAQARKIPGIREITLTTTRGAELVPLPEGNRYLGFVFADAASPAEAERSLRQAQRQLRFDIE